MKLAASLAIAAAGLMGAAGPAISSGGRAGHADEIFAAGALAVQFKTGDHAV